MSFSHADFARVLRNTIDITEKEMQWEVRKNRMHPMHAREHVAALRRCQEFHERAAREQQTAEAHMDDIAATHDAQREAAHASR